jgi:hypothetical protein
VPDRPGDMDERDVDARFASIVARWDGPVPDADDPPADDAPERPTAEPAVDAVTVGDPAEDTGEADAGEPAAPPVTPRSPWVNPSPLDVVVPASAWRAAEPADPATQAAAEEAEKALTEEEHFEPPEVVLPPQEDLHFWGAVIGLVAGPLMLLWVVFARPSHTTRWFVVSVIVSLVGFGLLVLRQPKHRDPTSGDDGARV